MCEFNAENFVIGDNYAIEASAGTGKTFNIVKIIEKLLNETKGYPDARRIRLKDILIVTYTEKAAGELKDRIRKAVPNEDVDDACIGTIHSFCQNTIEEFCLAAGKTSGLNLIDEGECRNYIKRYIRSGGIYPKICEFKKLCLDSELEKDLLNKFTGLIRSYYLNEKGYEDTKIVSLDSNLGFDRDLWEHYIENGEQLVTLFPNLRSDIQIIGNNQSKANGLRQLAALMNDGLIDNRIKFNRKYKPARGATSKETEAYYRLLEIFEKVDACEKNRENGPINMLVFDCIHDLYEKWQEEKEKNTSQTFNDMLRNVREEVLKENSPLLEALKKKYKVAIIDEFQDTNQKQWDIFRTVFLNEDHNIIVVGDPKQSIYSFQGADVTVYQNAVREISTYTGKTGHKEILKRNYRASGGMINCTNLFFGTDEYKKEEIFKNFQGSEVGKAELKARYDGKEDPAPAFWVFDKGPEVQIFEDDAAYAASVCGQIIDFCTVLENGFTKLRVTAEAEGEKGRYEERNVSFRDFAILCKTRSEMLPFMKALEKSGIPYIRYKDDTLFNGKECADWIAVLDAISAPDFTGNNRKKLRKALFTAFFGYTLEEIRSSKYDRDNIDEVKKFDSWKKLAADEKWETLIETIIDDTGLERRMGSLKHLKSLAVMNQIGDYCIDYLSGGRSLEALITHLRNLSQNNGEDDSTDGSGMIAKSTDFDCVKVMTIHASKGLEFPVVISGAGFKALPSSQDVYSCHMNGRYTLSLRKPPDDPFEVERYGEFHRLIYVAYTRAKYILMLPGCELPGAKAKNADDKVYNKNFISDALKEFRAIGLASFKTVTEEKVDYSELTRCSREILNHNQQQNIQGAGTNIVAQEEQLKTIKDNVFYHSGWSHSYSSLSKNEEKSSGKNQAAYDDGNSGNNLTGFDPKAVQIPCQYRIESPMQISPDFPRGTGIGLALHKIFELIDYQAPDPASHTLISDCLKEQCLHYRKSEWIDDIRQMVQRVLGAVFPLIQGSEQITGSMTLKDLSFADRKNEIEFIFNKENQHLHQYFNGVIDLIFRKDGRYAILDWKSNCLNEKFTSYCDKTALKGEVDREYSIQRVLYAYTLIKWLKQFKTSLTEEEIFNQYFGGVYYVFFRGCSEGTGNGIYAQTWNSWGDLKDAYDAVVRQKVKG